MKNNMPNWNIPNLKNPGPPPGFFLLNIFNFVKKGCRSSKKKTIPHFHNRDGLLHNKFLDNPDSCLSFTMYLSDRAIPNRTLNLT